MTQEHRLDGLNNSNWLSYSSGHWKAQDPGANVVGFWRRLSPRLAEAAFSLCLDQAETELWYLFFPLVYQPY